MDGDTANLAYLNLQKGIPWRFGPDWPGQRCGTKTRKSTPCQRPAYKHNGRCVLHGGRSIGPRTQRGLKRISAANFKHGRQTKDKLAVQRHAAEVGRRVMGELKRIENAIIDAGLMPTDD